jgi:hypothetical protein
MSLEYIREYYKVPAYAGHRVTYCGGPAVIVGGSAQYLTLHFDGQAKPDTGRYHPTWEIEYIGGPSQET